MALRCFKPKGKKNKTSKTEGEGSLKTITLPTHRLTTITRVTQNKKKMSSYDKKGFCQSLPFSPTLLKYPLTTMIALF